VDRKTGVAIRRVTSAPAIHHHPFFYIPAYDNKSRWLVIVSHRSGTPQILVEEQCSGNLVQLTDRPDINEWSVHPSHDGQFVYYTAGSAAYRVDTDSFLEEWLADFGDVPLVPPGMVGDAMGTTTLSHDDKWWAFAVRSENTARLHILNTSTGEQSIILERDSIGHPEFHPRDSNLLRYAGPYHDRLWVIGRDGSNHRDVYQRDEAAKEWIVHEVWNPLGRELLTVNWPNGMIGVDIDSGKVRSVCTFSAWHASISHDGRQMVCDTTWPDEGLKLFDPQDGRGVPRPLCESKSSNEGAHWQTDHCPYDDGPVQVYAPQHTHPHPSFSPDGRQVVFTSDRTGVAHVYVASLPG
jgi:oligogalacturonide lyase